MRPFVVSVLSVVLISAVARADVLYTLALTNFNGSDVGNGTGSFVISNPPPAPPATGAVDYLYYPTITDPTNYDTQHLLAMDFYIEGYHFFLGSPGYGSALVDFREGTDPNDPPPPDSTHIPHQVEYFNYQYSGDPNNPFSLIFTVDQIYNNGGYDYYLYQNLGDGQQLTVSGMVSITGIETTPEPSTLALLGTGLLGTVGLLRRYLA